LQIGRCIFTPGMPAKAAVQPDADLTENGTKNVRARVGTRGFGISGEFPMPQARVVGVS
jgi:hypothetical protein